MCDAVGGGKESIWEIWCEMEENIKFTLQRECLRRDTFPFQILMGSNAFVKGVMNREALQSAVERFSACGGAQFYCLGWESFLIRQYQRTQSFFAPTYALILSITKTLCSFDRSYMIRHTACHHQGAILS
jgi:hypothetical protein